MYHICPFGSALKWDTVEEMINKYLLVAMTLSLISQMQALAKWLKILLSKRIPIFTVKLIVVTIVSYKLLSKLPTSTMQLHKQEIWSERQGNIIPFRSLSHTNMPTRKRGKSQKR